MIGFVLLFHQISILQWIIQYPVLHSLSRAAGITHRGIQNKTTGCFYWWNEEQQQAIMRLTGLLLPQIILLEFVAAVAKTLNEVTRLRVSPKSVVNRESGPLPSLYRLKRAQLFSIVCTKILSLRVMCAPNGGRQPASLFMCVMMACADGTSAKPHLHKLA